MIKRMFDFLLAFSLLIILLPIMILISILIFLFMGSPILFTQIRPGFKEQIFTIYKFRTMKDIRDIHGELLPDSKRLVGFGKLIRSLSLDELPQLINVLKGDMSFVGPRPLLVEYLVKYNPEQKRRHDIKPGITGWAQVNGRNAISWEEKFSLDIWYVDNHNFWLDMKILGLTFAKVFNRKGINSSTSATMEKFNPI